MKKYLDKTKKEKLVKVSEAKTHFLKKETYDEMGLLDEELIMHLDELLKSELGYLDEYSVFHYGKYDKYPGYSYPTCVKDIICIMKEIPSLTKVGLEKIFKYYVKECFESKEYMEFYKTLLSSSDISDMTFELLVGVMSLYKDELKSKIETQIPSVDLVLQSYPDKFKEDIKELMKDHYITLDKIVCLLPKEELVKVDYEQYADLIYKKKCVFGGSKPISLSLLKGSLYGIISESEKYYYILPGDETVEALFTKEDYYDSYKLVKSRK